MLVHAREELYVNAPRLRGVNGEKDGRGGLPDAAALTTENTPLTAPRWFGLNLPI